LRVSGYYDGADWRFDTMSTPWKIASAIMSVLLPVAAVGLWSALSWGQVVWTMAIFTELMMYNWFPHYFGSNPIIVGFHLVSIAIYLGFLLAIRHYTKKR
jgi:hydrogenase/urease accessory protein HupE